MKLKEPKITTIKNKILALAKELNSEYHSDFVPLFPRVLVYVLPREQRIGHLWVPDIAKNQNKVTLEGVVIKTWDSPHIKRLGCIEEHFGCDEYDAEVICTQLKEGDHVLFPHSAGDPVSKESKDEFRLVKEGIPGYSDDYSIGCILNYKELEVKNALSTKLNELNWQKYDDTDIEAEKLMNEFIVYPKASKTLSGV